MIVGGACDRFTVIEESNGADSRIVNSTEPTQSTEVQRHAEELKQNPSEWMPWNYRQTLARLTRPAAA